MLISDNLNF
jgi:hypothetical protein